MINFLQERRDMGCNELLEQFACVYGFSKDDALKMMLELTALQVFCEKFGVTI